VFAWQCTGALLAALSFNALAFPRISSKSFEFWPVLFSIPTVPSAQHCCPDAQSRGRGV